MKRFLAAIVFFVCVPSFADSDQVEKIYEKLIAQHKNDSKYLIKANNARDAWRKFKKLHSEFLYSNHTGNMAGMCVNSCEYTIDNVVAMETKKLFPFVDGDTCSGVG
jgi:hypothetical protein